MELGLGVLVRKRLHGIDNAIFFFLAVQLASVMVSVAASSIAFVLAVTAWVARMWSEGSFRVQRTPLDYFFLAYVAAELLSTVFAVFPQESFVNMKRLFLIVLVYLAAGNVHNVNQVRILIGSVAIFAAVLSLLEIVLHLVFQQQRLHVFQHYMTTGGIKMILLLLLIPFLLHGETPNRTKIWVALAAVPIFVALLLTYTRSAWLGFLAGLVVIGLVRTRWVLAGLVALIVAFFLLAPEPLTQRALSIVDPNDPTVASRLTMWSTGLRIFADYPIFGIGDTDVHELYARYKSSTDTEFGGHMHSNYVHLLVTLGGVGFLAVMALFSAILVTEFHIYRQIKDGWIPASVSLGAFSVFVAFLVAGLFEWNFGDHEIMTLVWTSVGLSLATRQMTFS